MVSDRTLRFVLRSESLVALLGDLIRAVTAVLAIAVVAIYLAYYAAVARVVVGQLNMNDFGKFYYSTRAFLDGRDMYAPNPATAIPVGPFETREFSNLNPPHFHLLILPIARLEPVRALAVWTFVSLLSLGAGLWVITHELGLRSTLSGALWALVALLACSATGAIVMTGQITFLLMLPFTLAWRAARRGHWVHSATHLGVIASIKPLFAILGIVLLIGGQVKAAVVMVLVAGVCLMLGLVIFGWEAHLSWLNALSSVQWKWALMNASLHAPLARALTDNPFFDPLVRAPGLVQPIGTMVGLVVALITFTVMARDASPLRVDRAFALLILTALLVSPLGWIYYLWFALGPLVALWNPGSLRHWPWPGAILLLAAPGLVYPVTLTLAARDYPWGSLTVGSIYTWSILLLWLAVLWSPRSSAKSP